MQLKNKVVVRCMDGRLVKGYTWDFGPNKEVFHVADADDERKVTKFRAEEAKAVFYVRSFDGDRHRAHQDFTEESLRGFPGVKLKITFRDGEVMYGTTTGYSPGRRGFFVVPVDETSNNERVYVFASATQSVDSWR